MAVSYGAQCISILIISYVLHIMMHFDNCCKSRGGAVRPNFLFLMLSHHFLRMCGNWLTPSGVHCKLVTTHLLVLCWHQTYLYCHPFLSVGAVFYFSLFLFSITVCFYVHGLRACYSIE